MLLFLLLFPLSLFGEITVGTAPLSQIDHPVSTQDKEAQYHFNQGLTYLFAFNHDLALREFELAAKRDPNLAMAYWGMALAVGQNINTDVTPENEIRGYNYVQQALKLSSPSEVERRYIQALAVRYTNNPTADLTSLRLPYKEEMGKLSAAYPEDLDAATLYAESILDLNPWKWWTPEGKPQDGTFEAVDVLESVLDRNPLHIGANHFYVHAMEESPYPERGLLSAERLETLLPESGHLLHMPCHIFLLTGNYERAIRTNTKAIEADRKYIQKYGMGGEYPTHYLPHNMYVLARTYMLMEDYPNAIRAANELIQFLNPYFATNSHIAHFAYTPLEIMLYFKQWDSILQFRPPSQAPIVEAFWHYSRGVALAAQGNTEGALQERDLMIASKQKITPHEEIANNPATRVFDFAGILLDGWIANAQGNGEGYIEALRRAIPIQDAFFYDEPPAWSTPIRVMLGEALLSQNKFKEAENPFRETLQKYRRNGRALLGLYNSLKGQNREWDAFWVQRELVPALRHFNPN